MIQRAVAEPEVIAHHFAQAGLEDPAIEWWGKAGDQALRRSAFQEAIAHLGKAIEMADRAGGGKAGDSGERARLHADYANALIPARGYGVPETTEAFAKARESAVGDKDAPARLAADYGLWVGSIARFELSAARAYAAAFLSDVGARPDSPEVGVAHRIMGTTHWLAGEYREAREHLERSLALFEPGRDDNFAFRFGQDAGVATMVNLAFTLWPLGEVETALSFLGDAEARTASITHVGTLAYTKWQIAIFELLRGDHVRAASNGVELARLAREHDLPMWLAFGLFLEGMATAEGGAFSERLDDMRRGVELLREQNVLTFDGPIKIALAEAEARAGDVGRALAILDEALATSKQVGQSAFDPELHRVRGEMLLKRDPTSPAPAAEAFRTAVIVAKQQSTRSFELRSRSRSPSSTNRRPAPPKRTPYSRPRSKAFRRHPKCPRSPTRRRCSRRWGRPKRSRPQKRSGNGSCTFKPPMARR
jgi:tetratricopeptide (TPR) repeat protein